MVTLNTISRSDKILMVACSLLLAFVSVLGLACGADARRLPARPATAVTQTAGDGSIRHPEVPSAAESMVTADGRTRTYQVFVPASYDGSTPVPLVLVFHGAGGSGAQVEKQTGFDEVADANGFIVVYPDGTSARDLVPTWNAGHCCGYARTAGVDDVAFVNQLLDRLESDYAIDSARVYAIGFSNGSMFTYRLACDLSDRIAAFAPVSGTTPIEGCAPSRPVPILAFHGTADDIVPYAGGPVTGGAPGAEYPPVETLIAAWAELDGCDPQPAVTTEASATRTAYTACDAGVTVTLYAITNGSHSWPGGLEPVERSGVHSDLDATALIWSFFQQYEQRSNEQ